MKYIFTICVHSTLQHSFGGGAYMLLNNFDPPSGHLCPHATELMTTTRLHSTSTKSAFLGSTCEGHHGSFAFVLFECLSSLFWCLMLCWCCFSRTMRWIASTTLVYIIFMNSSKRKLCIVSNFMGLVNLFIDFG